MVDETRSGTLKGRGDHKANILRLFSWKKTLRLGDTGAEVKRLQSLLASMGFYASEPDGVFGYLTQDAVERLQAEFGLRIDGIAGSMVNRVLQHPGPTRLRRCVPVEAGETVEAIAAKLDVPKTLVVRKRPRGGFLPNTLFCLQSSLVIGYLAEEKAVHLSGGFPVEARELTALAYLWWPLDRQQTEPLTKPEVTDDVARACKARLLPIIGTPVYSGASDEEGGGRAAGALSSRQMVRILRQAAVKACSEPANLGVCFRFGRLPAVLGPAVARILKEAAKAAARYQKFVFVAVPGWQSPGRGAWGLSWEILGRLIHYIVLEPALPTQPSSLLPLQQLRTSLSRWARVVPPWQLLQVVPVGGITADQGRVSYNVVRTLAYRKKAVVQWEPTAYSPMFSYNDEDGETHEAWYENSESISRKLDVIQSRKLAGVCLSPVGYEDSRVWEVIKQRMVIGHS